MWLILGITSIIIAIVNAVMFSNHKHTQLLSYISLSFTVLTLCAFHSNSVAIIRSGDMGAVWDVVQGLPPLIWIATASSIVINAIPYFINFKKKLDA